MRILVVDDHARLRQIVRFALQKIYPDGLEVEEAEDGQDAIRRIQNDEVEFDLALVDLKMPRLDGIGFLKQLRALGPLKEVPVIMLTAEAGASTVAEAVRWGARDYIVKPFTQETLREKVRKALSHTEARKNKATAEMLSAIATGGDPEAGTPFLLRLSPSLRKALAARGHMRTYDAGSTILLPHQTATALHLVVLGEIEEAEAGKADSGAEEIRTVGDCFAEDSFVTGRPVGAVVRARTRVEVLIVNKIEIGGMARKFPELGYALSGLVAQRSRKKERPAGAAAPELAGSLQTLPISDLVQFLHLCHKTGHLSLRKAGTEAGLFFENGELRHARLGPQGGEEAFYQMMAWRDADFSFESGRCTQETSITQPTMTVLLEGARRLDELSRN